MKSTEEELEDILIEAREKALPIITSAIADALPEGWTAHLAVGWSFTVFDEKDKMVYDHLLPDGLRRIMADVWYFENHFGNGNEIIKSSKDEKRDPTV